MNKFRCSVCNWVFSEQKEDNLFESLSESFTCPICGGEGYRVEDPQQLDSVIQKAFSSANPALIDVIVDSQKVAHSTKRVD